MSEDNSESEIIITGDGSHTVYSSRFDQHFHNPNGAIAESQYVFFEQTGLLDQLSKSDSVTILEVGFGTGLNLMLLADYCLSNNWETHINYYSIEGFPIKPEVAADLNYKQHLKNPEDIPATTSIFEKLSKGMNEFTFSDNILVHLFNGLFEDFGPGEGKIDADFIFYDAFSPDVNPSLWTGGVFKKLKTQSADNVILSTYCAASKAKGAMAWAGWKVARTKGALGKREMTLAALDAKRLGDLKRVNEERLAKRYEEGDFN